MKRVVDIILDLYETLDVMQDRPGKDRMSNWKTLANVMKNALSSAGHCTLTFWTNAPATWKKPM
eukprot:1668481-Rhodomonas_salina.2